MKRRELHPRDPLRGPHDPRAPPALDSLGALSLVTTSGWFVAVGLFDLGGIRISPAWGLVVRAGSSFVAWLVQWRARTHLLPTPVWAWFAYAVTSTATAMWYVRARAWIAYAELILPTLAVLLFAVPLLRWRQRAVRTRTDGPETGPRAPQLPPSSAQPPTQDASRS